MTLCSIWRLDSGFYLDAGLHLDDELCPYVPMIIQQPVVGVTTLKSKKSPWAHLSRTLNRPGWLGGNAKIGSTGS